MDRILLYITIIFFAYSSKSQTHSIGENSMEMFCISSDYDMSINTFYNAYDTCNITWSVINDSTPPEWTFSFCFPNCYAEGIINGQNTFFNGDKKYLNCHIYPHGKIGIGKIQMEIITNNIHVDTITWTGNVSGISSNQNNNLIRLEDDILNIYTLTGKKVSEMLRNTLYIVEYNNRTRKIIYNNF